MWLLIVLVAIWSIFIEDGQINRDGLLYVKQAYFFAEGDFEKGFSLFAWPFFSILIAFFHKLTSLDLQTTAHAVDLFLFGIASFYFLKIIQLIYKQKNIIFYGGLLLITFVPVMDDYVNMVLRDHGLWAGFLAGVYFYLKYINSNFAFKYNLLWQFSFIFGGLFRPECLVFLFLIPLLNIFFLKNYFIKKYTLRRLLPEYILLVLCVFVFFLGNIFNLSIKVGRLVEFYPRVLSFYEQLTNPLPLYSENINLNNLLKDKYLFITLTTLGSLFVMKFITCQGILNIYLIFKHFRDKPKATNSYLKPLYFFLIISLLIVFISFVNNFILTDRYFIFSHLIVLIIITPALSSLFEGERRFSLTYQAFVVIFLIFSFLSILIDRNLQNIELQSGNYLKELNLNHDNVGLINADRIAYYGGFSIEDIINSHSIEPIQKEWIVHYSSDNSKPPLILHDVFREFYHKDQTVVFLKKR